MEGFYEKYRELSRPELLVDPSNLERLRQFVAAALADTIKADRTNSNLPPLFQVDRYVDGLKYRVLGAQAVIEQGVWCLQVRLLLVDPERMVGYTWLGDEHYVVDYRPVPTQHEVTGVDEVDLYNAAVEMLADMARSTVGLFVNG